ncbi:hypothetical protein [Serinicoccus sp. CNJ-927]|uniref:hypothetical protein n=1 Tax=Serinicoccus sp. CNJ-927 TaxID=1904970 RepID=UPI00130180B8|nr:hypothetical protein [Serinicoccus sp. CNJ-927]
MGQAWERTKQYLGFAPRAPGAQAIYDGPHVCAECFALIHPSRVAEHEQWHRRHGAPQS